MPARSDPIVPESLLADCGRLAWCFQLISVAMSADPLRKTVAARPRYHLSLPALPARLRELRERVPGELSVEDVERELERIETRKMSKAKAVQARQNLRDRIIYALTDADLAACVGSGLQPVSASAESSSTAASGSAVSLPAWPPLPPLPAPPPAPPPPPQLPVMPPSPQPLPLDDPLLVEPMLAALPHVPDLPPGEPPVAHSCWHAFAQLGLFASIDCEPR